MTGALPQRARAGRSESGAGTDPIPRDASGAEASG